MGKKVCVCYFLDSDGIVKCNCHKNYGGLQCLYCAHNYYLVGKQCLACSCNNNTDPNYRACKMDTGEGSLLLLLLPFFFVFYFLFFSLVA